MLIPLRHENMSARRWPVVTFTFIAINVVAFLLTHGELQRQAPELGKVKAHILVLAAMHPELNVPPEVQPLITTFRDHNPGEWKQLQNQSHELIDGWDARMRLTDDPEALQAEMDSLASDYTKLNTSSLSERYAFVPAHPTAMAYLTANFLHGGWLHLIGNMWFLWLAGFVLEDAWGRGLYALFYLIAGAAALQFHAWTNAGSLVPTLGASGAVAALMGAFLVRFPKIRIEMGWILFLRMYRFQAPAYCLLPLWLLTEVFYGTLFGQISGVAHWAHVGGFLFGALAAVLLRYSGVEQKVDQAIESDVGWTTDADIHQASQLLEENQLDQARDVLQKHIAAHSDTTDAHSLLAQVYWRKGDIPAYREATIKLCELHLRARAKDAAWQDYQDLLNAGSEKLPPAIWLELCRIAEERQDFQEAQKEYQKLATSWPGIRQALEAQLGAAKILLKRLNRPAEALKLYQAVATSSVPHLDLEQTIQSGIHEAQTAVSWNSRKPEFADLKRP